MTTPRAQTAHAVQEDLAKHVIESHKGIAVTALVESMSLSWVNKWHREEHKLGLYNGSHRHSDDRGAAR